MGRTHLWIFGRVIRGKNWVVAENSEGEMVAKNPDLQQLEKSLDIMFEHNWVGLVTLDK